MNRRRVLQTAGVLGTVALAGCIDGVREHFGLQGVVPMEIHSEADNSYNLQLQAQEHDSGRQTYEEAYAITPGESVYPPNLEQTDQSLHIVKFDGTEDGDESTTVREVSITSNTQLVLVYLRDDDLVVDVSRGETGENETIDDSPTDVDADDLDVDDDADGDENADTDAEDENDDEAGEGEPTEDD